MGQLIAALLAIIAAKLIWDTLKEQTSKRQKPGASKQGEVIDISDAWIDMNEMPYKKRDNLLMARELAIYHIIADSLAGSNYTVFPRVRLADILYLSPDAHNYREYLSRIEGRSADLLVCQIEDLKPILLVIGQGKAAGRKKQMADRFIKKAAQSAGLSVIDFDISNPPSLDELVKSLRLRGLEL